MIRKILKLSEFDLTNSLLKLTYNPDRILPSVMSGYDTSPLPNKIVYEPVKASIFQFMTENPDLPEIRFLNFYLEQIKHASLTLLYV